MVSLGVLSLDGTKLAGNAAHRASKTLPQIEKLLAEAAAVDAAEDAEHEGRPEPARALVRRAERRERLPWPGTGWWLRTRRAGRRSGLSSKLGTRPPQLGNGAD